MPDRADSPLPVELAELLLLCTGGRAHSVEVVQTLWSGYGQLLRCRLSDSTSDSVVVKHVRWPSTQDHPRGWNSTRSHQRKVRSYQVEAQWYRRYAERCGEGCRVPRCIAANLGDEVALVLEDLDGAGFEGRRTRVGDVEVKACLTWLAEFHATFLGTAPEELWEVGTYWHLATRPDELEVLEDGPLKDSAADIDRRLSAGRFQTLVHGDAKLANFCFSADGSEVAAVDFQYVGGGCGMKDVAYFISSCLDEDEAERQEQSLLDFYFSRLERALIRRNPEVDVAALVEEWRALYALAWTDFYRFLKGWSPGHWKIHRYSERLAHEVLAAL
ncbi:MAG: aminoglycoside phosphotransferase (APT) family kinase protein [Myxococcota bacterium]|jgi:aminoglycoside phosphotransferase (APT) family kinase protein